MKALFLILAIFQLSTLAESNVQYIECHLEKDKKSPVKSFVLGVKDTRDLFSYENLELSEVQLYPEYIQYNNPKSVSEFLNIDSQRSVVTITVNDSYETQSSITIDDKVYFPKTVKALLEIEALDSYPLYLDVSSNEVTKKEIIQCHTKPNYIAH